MPTWLLTLPDGRLRPVGGDVAQVALWEIRAIVARKFGFSTPLPIMGWVSCISDVSRLIKCGVDAVPDRMKAAGRTLPCVIDAAFGYTPALAALLEAGASLENDCIYYGHNITKTKDRRMAGEVAREGR